MTIFFDDLLPSFSQLYNSAFVESLVLRSQKLNDSFLTALFESNFSHSNGFEMNAINDSRMVQGQDYTVDVASLPSLTPIIFCEWPKMYVDSKNKCVVKCVIFTHYTRCHVCNWAKCVLTKHCQLNFSGTKR